jgi:hypothetical protein
MDQHLDDEAGIDLQHAGAAVDADLAPVRPHHFLTVHARNLEHQVAGLRRHRRALEQRLREVEHREQYWKGLYQSVVTSWSWRAAWFILTPYRGWVAVRQRRSESAHVR